MEPDTPTPRAVSGRTLTAIFVVALAAHAWLTFFNLKVPFLAGHEFRQSQTALIAYYIDKQSSFSPLYEQPILGKPWKAFMLEFPLYQWCVVGLSRVTGWEHFLAARVVSIASFYATLPALCLLLGRLGLTRPRRLFVLALVLACPVYIFYTRAFLIDSMALMFSAWFVAGFVRTMDRRSFGWLAATMVAGGGAALVKGFIYAIWLWPAAAYGAWCLWRACRPWAGWGAPVRTVAWGLATVAVPFGALKGWLAVTDPLKAAHPSAWIFTSKNLSVGNWGLFDFNSLFSREVWHTLTTRWSEALMNPWLLLALFAAGLVALPRARKAAAGLAAVFLLSQVLFPFAYAYQDYYYYSCAAFAVGALGLLALALLESRVPRWVSWLLIAGLFAGQLHTYWHFYRPQQAVKADGWTTLTRAINELTPPNSVIIVAGADWAAMTPYYSERRALMIRNGLEFDRQYLERAYADLADEDVAALVLQGNMRGNHPFLDFTLERLDFERVPTFQHPQGDVYLRRLYVQGAQVVLRNSSRYGLETKIVEQPPRPRAPMPVPAATARTAFRQFSPAPFACDMEFGVDWTPVEGPSVLSAHADSYLWIRPPEQARRIMMEFGLHAGSWNRGGPQTNGVVFGIVGEVPGGPERVIYRRVLAPATVEGDRGPQTAELDYAPRPGETLRFESLGNGSIAFDWAYWRSITIK